MQRGSAAVTAVIALELMLLRPEIRASVVEVDRLLDPEFQEIGASGRLWTRQEMLDELTTSEAAPSITADDFDGSELAPGMVLITWRSTMDVKVARRSSLWRWSDGRWRILFHQGTRMPVGD